MTQRKTPPFRADHVGSLLRPAELHEARAKARRGEMGAEALRALQDRHIRDAVAKQESVGMQLVEIPAGSFTMGAPEDEKGEKNERPQRRVKITKAFFMGAHEVTQKQYALLMGENPSWFSALGGGKVSVKGLDTEAFPVEGVRRFLEWAGREAPADDRVWLGRANLATRMGLYDEAASWLDRCESRRPASVPDAGIRDHA